MSEKSCRRSQGEASTTCESLLTTTESLYRRPQSPVPGRFMAARAAQRRVPPPQSLVSYTKALVTGQANPTRDSSSMPLYRRAVDMGEVQRILEEADRAEQEREALRSKPLPPRPRLRDVLRGPAFKPPGTSQYVQRLAANRVKQEAYRNWVNKVDGKTTPENPESLWIEISKGKWGELDSLVEQQSSQ